MFIRFPSRLFQLCPAALLCAAGVACNVTATRAEGSAAYSPLPFGHYQPILDRMPFGALPANFNATATDVAAAKNEAQVKAEQQAIAKKINMSAVNVTPDGSTAIGFTDLSVNPPVSYYLRVGESSGGWTVQSADYDTEIAAIEKDGVSITLKLGQGLVDAPPPRGAGPAPAAIPAAVLPSPAAAGILPTVKHNRPLSPIGLSRFRKPEATNAVAVAAEKESETRSYAERLRERTSQKTKEQMAAEARMREQFEKLARETAAREIQRREEEAAQAAQEQEDQAAQQQGQPMAPLPEDQPPEEQQ